jgi:hypothetical protein
MRSSREPVWAALGCLLHLDEKVSLGNLQEFPLAEYAARNWVEHALFENVARNMLDGLKRLFDESRPHFVVWVRIYDLKSPWRRTSRSERPCQPGDLTLRRALRLEGHRKVPGHGALTRREFSWIR